MFKSRKDSEAKIALLDKGIVSRKAILMESLIESGLLLEGNSEVFDKFWKVYKEKISVVNANPIFDL